MAITQGEKTDRIRAKVERMGVFFERSGFAPMTGRVFAYLLVCEPPHKDFFVIQEFLQASKSAVSNALTTLTTEGIVDYITFSGDRRRYFKINTTGWLNSLKTKLRRVTVLGDLLDEVLTERCDSSSQAFSEDLNKIIEFQHYMSNGIEKLLDEWDKK
jgi:DNA-binding transcriptional regulator GbsR (MarR family)